MGEGETGEGARGGRLGNSGHVWIISLLALGLATLHIVRPSLGVDAITLGLLGLAAIPFILPRLKAAEITGVGKFEFQELQKKVEDGVQRVETAAKRVEEVAASFSISGADNDERATIEDALQGFHTFLTSLGFQAKDTPKVLVKDDGQNNSHYDVQNEEIVVSRPFAADPDAVRREYAHHVLLDGRDYEPGSPLDGIESALADYLPCAFKKDAALGRLIAIALQKEVGFEKPFIRNLDNARLFSELEDKPELHDEGEIWGGLFWELRLRHKELVDAALCEAWRTAPKTRRDFWRALLEALQPDAAKTAVTIGIRRKLKEAAPPAKARAGREPKPS
jgi:hypothetical protein